MIGKLLRLGALIGLASVGLLATGSLATAGQGGCSTHGLAFTAGKTARYKVVHLTTQGLTCSKARTIAQQVAQELLHNKPISLNGVTGLSMSTNSCTGCPSTTDIALSYPSGKITVSLSGKAPQSSTPLPTTPFPTIPWPTDPFPAPTTPAPGNQHTITV